eukprot:jgi/Phyca11/12852/fgenesh1_pg.PHYCAscaffold_1_\
MCKIILAEKGTRVHVETEETQLAIQGRQKSTQRVEKEELWEGFGIDTDYEDEPEEIESAVKEEDDSANEEESACEKEEIAEDKDVESAGEGGAGGSGESSGDIERDGESASGAANESNGARVNVTVTATITDRCIFEKEQWFIRQKRQTQTHEFLFLYLHKDLAIATSARSFSDGGKELEQILAQQLSFLGFQLFERSPAILR